MAPSSGSLFGFNAPSFTGSSATANNLFSKKGDYKNGSGDEEDGDDAGDIEKEDFGQPG